MAWNAWGALKQRAHIILRYRRLDDRDGQMWHEPDGTVVIELDARLDRNERHAVLAHELIHEERGGSIDWEGSPPTWAAIVAREEQIVDREVARRLVPPDELAAFLTAAISVGEIVTVRVVADWFDVPEWVAAAALCAA